MKVTVFGMGYVGSVSAACFASQGHEVVGVDSDTTKVETINSGRSPIVEPGLDELISQVIAKGRLQAVVQAPALGDVSLVCVGTPSKDNGSLDLTQVLRVCEDLGQLLRAVGHYHVINIRSTVVPGTVESKILPLLEEKSGKKAGRDFGVCMNPEFLRESTAIKDFFAPPFTVIGALDAKSGEVVGGLYSSLEAPLQVVPIRVAEMIKYACNSFHALKISFANEIGNLCKAMDIDSWQVMDVFCKDDKLNLSSYYLKPGFAFGGSCLPKDLRAIVRLARDNDLEVPVLGAVLASNQMQIERAYNMIRRLGKTQVGVLGLSFKSGSDDLRESPTVALIERLIGKGYHVRIYDDDVTLSQVRGKNRQFIDRVLPHISSLLKPSIEEVIGSSEVIAVCKRQEEFGTMLKRVKGNLPVIDLVRTLQKGSVKPVSYEGICW